MKETIRDMVRRIALDRQLTPARLSRAVGGKVSPDSLEKFFYQGKDITVGKLEHVLPMLGLELRPIALTKNSRPKLDKIVTSPPQPLPAPTEEDTIEHSSTNHEQQEVIGQGP